MARPEFLVCSLCVRIWREPVLSSPVLYCISVYELPSRDLVTYRIIYAIHCCMLLITRCCNPISVHFMRSLVTVLLSFFSRKTKLGYAVLQAVIITLNILHKFNIDIHCVPVETRRCDIYPNNCVKVILTVTIFTWHFLRFSIDCCWHHCGEL